MTQGPLSEDVGAHKGEDAPVAGARNFRPGSKYTVCFGAEATDRLRITARTTDGEWLSCRATFGDDDRDVELNINRICLYWPGWD